MAGSLEGRLLHDRDDDAEHERKKIDARLGRGGVPASLEVDWNVCRERSVNAELQWVDVKTHNR